MHVEPNAATLARPIVESRQQGRAVSRIMWLPSGVPLAYCHFGTSGFRDHLEHQLSRWRGGLAVAGRFYLSSGSGDDWLHKRTILPVTPPWPSNS